MDKSITVHCSTTWDEAIDCRIVGMTEECWQSLPAVEAGTLEHAVLLRAREDGEFGAKSKETLLLHCGTELAPRLLVVGLGAMDKLNAAVFRQAAALAVSLLRQKKLSRWLFDCDTFCSNDTVSLVDSLADGVFLEAYRFDRYKKDESDSTSLQCVLAAIDKADLPAAEQQVKQRQIISGGVWLSRNLVNEPGNVKTPVYLAEQAWQLAEQHGMKCTLLGPDELQRQGFGAMLAVAKGSICEPRLIVLDYQGAGDDVAPIALVGKGVTFDSGGISLKPGEGMEQMKMDMAGGAAVLGALSAAAQLKLPLNLVGVVPAVENMPSDRATRPGDVVTSLSGKTIEIINTDAEGRLILADALTWTARRKPQLMIDLATLTGACIIALGHHSSAVLGNDEALIDELRRAGDHVGERVWPLPLFAEYSEQIKSQVADVKNIGGRPAGTITAAAFLEKFVEDLPWAHLDIAGTAWEDKGKPGQPNGGTGVGVRLLIDFLRQRCSDNG